MILGDWGIPRTGLCIASCVAKSIGLLLILLLGPLLLLLLPALGLQGGFKGGLFLRLSLAILAARAAFRFPALDFSRLHTRVSQNVIQAQNDSADSQKRPAAENSTTRYLCGPRWALTGRCRSWWILRSSLRIPIRILGCPALLRLRVERVTLPSQ